jgi:actin-related protein
VLWNCCTVLPSNPVCHYLTGMEERLAIEMKAMVPPSMVSSVNIYAPPDRMNSIWKGQHLALVIIYNWSDVTDYEYCAGGSILASLSTFDDQWITKEEFEEFGTNILQEKCPIHV